MDSNTGKNRDFDSPMGIPEGQRTPPPSYEMASPSLYPALKQGEPMPMPMPMPMPGQPGIATQQVHVGIPSDSSVHVVNAQQEHVIVLGSFGPDSTHTQCPTCKEFVQTTVERKAGRVTYCWSLVLLCLCWPLSCVPCCIDGCLDSHHTCPKCGAFLGVYRQ